MSEPSVTPLADEAVPSLTDGRAVRAERTRTAVVDALLTLNDDGHLRPTARAIADRAGVSVRSLYVHFDDLEALMVAAAQRHSERMQQAAPPMVAEGGFAERLDAFVARRAAIHEAAAGVYRAALLQEPTSPAIQTSLRRGRRLLRAEVRHCFAPELDPLPSDVRRRLVAALDVATCSAAWEHLRTHQGHSADDAAGLVRAMVLTLFEGWPTDGAAVHGGEGEEGAADPRGAGHARHHRAGEPREGSTT